MDILCYRRAKPVRAAAKFWYSCAMSLIPEKQLNVSPSLAATIGLEEALLLGILGDFLLHGQTEKHNGFDWLNISSAQLRETAPFWTERDIQRIVSNLRDQGILLIASAPFAESQQLRFAINQHKQPDRSLQSVPVSVPEKRGTSPIAHNWQPDRELLRQLAQYNIPQHFTTEQVPEFVTYWSERGESQHSWGSKFIKHVLKLWRQQQTVDTRKSRETPMGPDWRPSLDAMDILVDQAAISRHFIEDAIPEFILYWSERGERSSTWNSRFILHIKRQWARFTAVMKSDSEPRPISTDWQPDETVYDVLTLANIDRSFAERQVAEFVLYWKDTGRVESSWNTRFLQNVKRQWASHSALANPASQHTMSHSNERQQRSYKSGNSRGRSVVEQLTDRSWAS